MILWISQILIPLTVCYIIGFGLLSGRPVFDDFLEGAASGMKTAAGLLPVFVGLMIAVGVLRSSGLLETLGQWLSIPAGWLHLPTELVPVTLVRLVSNSAATGLLLDLFEKAGPDSPLGMCASVMMSCTETVFYCLSENVDTYAALNDVLVNLFRDIMELEEQAIITQEYQDITNNDMHVIEAIGVGEPKNMSTIAKLLSVTVGTLTIAMNSLVKKGYVIRERGKEDRRVVYISLSEKGLRAYRHHEEFHRQMIEAVLENLTEDETESLVKALAKLERWFRRTEEN